MIKQLIASAIISSPLLAQGGARPLTLRALFDTVSSSYPAIRAAASRVRASEGVRTTTRSLMNPTLTWQVENSPFPRGRPIPGLDKESMLMAMVPLEPLYQRWSRIGAADAMVREADAERAATRQESAMSAASAFYRVAMAEVGVGTSRDLVAWLDTIVAYNRSRVEEGAAAEAELIRSRIERDIASAQAAAQEAELFRARAALASFLSDKSAWRALSVAPSPGPLPLPGAGPPTSVDAVASVRAAQGRADAAQAMVAAERAMIVRQLSATFGQKEMAGTRSMIAGLSLPLPMFDQNRGEIARAAAQRDASESDLALSRREATAQLEGAQEAARILTARLAELEGTGNTSLLARAEETRRITLGAYREGAVPLIQVLDAARAWGEARMAWYTTLYSQHESVLALFAAQGIDLLDHLPAAPAAPTNR